MFEFKRKKTLFFKKIYRLPKKMTSTTIHQLHHYALVNVFSFLDAKSLLNASRVCKAWSEKIGSSPVTMNKFKLKLWDWKSFEDDSKCYWKHYNVEINFTVTSNQVLAEDAPGDAELYMKILEKFDFTGTRNFSYIRPNADFRLLSKMPMLEKLELNFETMPEQSESSFQQLNFPRLRSLSIRWDSSPSHILKFINAKNLETLKLRTLKGRPRPNETIEDNDLTNLLKGMAKLKKLTMYDHVLAKMINDQQYFDFQLTDLSCGFEPTLSILNMEKFNQFLRSQSASLVSFNFVCSVLIPMPMIETILSCKKLSSVSLNSTRTGAFSLPENGNMYNQIEPSRVIKELTIRRYVSKDPLRHFLGKCPNIKWFKFEEAYDDIINDISHFCPNLKGLKMDDCRRVPEKSLARLNFLQIQKLTRPVELSTFLERHPSITTISLKEVSGDAARPCEIKIFLKTIVRSHLIFRHKCHPYTKHEMAVVLANSKYEKKNGNFVSLQIILHGSSLISRYLNFLDEKEWKIEEREDVKAKLLGSLAPKTRILNVKRSMISGS